MVLRDEAAKDHSIRVTLRQEGDWAVDLASESLDFALRDGGERCLVFSRDGVDRPLWWLVDDGRVHVQWEGRSASFVDVTYAAASESGDLADGKVRALSNGRVASLRVSVGDKVEAGTALLTIEAMKMEHMHVAAVAGVVKAILVAQGDSVMTGRALVEIEAG